MRGGAPPGGARRKASPAPPRRPSRQDAPSLHTRHNAASVQLGTRREVAGGGEWGRESSASRARSTDVGRGGHLRTLHPRSPWLHSHFEQLTSCSQAKPLNSRACNNKAKREYLELMIPGFGLKFVSSRLAAPRGRTPDSGTVKDRIAPLVRASISRWFSLVLLAALVPSPSYQLAGNFSAKTCEQPASGSAKKTSWFCQPFALPALEIAADGCPGFRARLAFHFGGPAYAEANRTRCPWSGSCMCRSCGAFRAAASVPVCPAGGRHDARPS